jgi:hypothetical protein
MWIAVGPTGRRRDVLRRAAVVAEGVANGRPHRKAEAARVRPGESVRAEW